MTAGAHAPATELAWRRAALALLPGGASTGSKRPEALFGPDGDGPTHFVRASGCSVETVGGARLLDCTMALGAVALGYADPGVTDAVIAAAREGPVSGLSSVHEVALAERLVDVIPCAEQVRFLKTGAEAVAAAVRLARVATGREHVLCAGYFGWLDWSADGAGVPAGTRATTHRVPFDDVEALAAAVDALAGRGLAAIVVEPVVEQLASPRWLAAIRAHCDRLGAVFVLDEVKTGFRLATGGAHARLGVRPDLAVFGKAMANGYPLAAVAGSAAVMGAARRTWISSTLASESVALAAAAAVLDRHAAIDVCGALAAQGAALRAAVEAALAHGGVTDLVTAGEPAMWGLRGAPARLDALVQRAVEHGVLLKRGFYHFASLAHDADCIAAIGARLADAARRLGAPA
jgi:glutamate-1-semialdehyde 2,1-aminomutase